MSTFIFPEDAPSADTPPPATDADGRLPWELAPDDGYPASTSGGDGPSSTDGSADPDADDSSADDPSADDPSADDADDPSADDASPDDLSADPDASASDPADPSADPDPAADPDASPDLEASADAEGADGGAAPPYSHPAERQDRDRLQGHGPAAARRQRDRDDLQAPDRWGRRRHQDSREPGQLDARDRPHGSDGRRLAPLRPLRDDEGRRAHAEGHDRPCISLGEPEVKTLDGKAEAVVDEDHAIKVATWGAVAYDTPGQPKWFAMPEVDDAKVSDAQKGDVIWRIAGNVDATLTGAQITYKVPKEQAGKTVTVEAYRKQNNVQKLTLLVGQLTIGGSGKGHPKPPAYVPLNGDVALQASLAPADLVKGATYAWTASSGKVTLTPGDAGAVTAHGATASDSDGDVTLTCTATVNGTSWTATTTVTVKNVPDVKAKDGTSDPPKFAPQWHYIYLKAVVPPGLAGAYKWEASDKLKIMSGSRAAVAIVMATKVSDATDDQWVQVTFTPTGGTALPPVKVQVTAIAVVFAKDPAQRYGFDNMDGAPGEPPRLSIKKNDWSTVKVTLRGPGLTSDKITFTSDTPSIAGVTAPDAGQTEFMLKITGGAQNKAEAPIRARLGDASGAMCATVTAVVYKQFEASATVFRVWDSTSPTSKINAFSVADAQTLMNTWYKAAVVRVTLTDSGLLDVPFDLNKNGKCDIGTGTATAEENLVTPKLTGAGQQVVLVKDVEWRYTLTADAAKGSTTVTFDQAAFMKTGKSWDLLDTTGTKTERITAQTLNGTTLTLQTPLAQDHKKGEYLEWGLAGRSGNPTAWIEQGGDDVTTTCTAAHELGHALMSFKDLNQLGLIMNYYVQSNRALTLRYKSMAQNYDGGTENQWDLVSRD